MPTSDSSQDKATQDIDAESLQENLESAELEEDDFLATGPDIPVPEDAFRRWKEERQREIAAQEAAVEEARAAQEAELNLQEPQEEFWQSDQFEQTPQGMPFPVNDAMAQQQFPSPDFAAAQGFVPPAQNQMFTQGFSPYGNQVSQMPGQTPFQGGPVWQNGEVQAQPGYFDGMASMPFQSQDTEGDSLQDQDGSAQDMDQSQLSHTAEYEAVSSDVSAQEQPEIGSSASTSYEQESPASGFAAPTTPTITSPQPPAIPTIPEHFRSVAPTNTSLTDAANQVSTEASSMQEQDEKVAFGATGDSEHVSEAPNVAIPEHEGIEGQPRPEQVFGTSSEETHEPAKAEPSSYDASPFASNVAQDESLDNQIIGSHVKSSFEQDNQAEASAVERTSDSFDLPISTSQFKRVEFESGDQPSSIDNVQNAYDPAFGQISPYGEYAYQNYDAEYQQHPQDAAWSQYQNWQYQSQMPSMSPQDQMAAYQQNIPQEEPYAGFQQDQMISQYAAASAIEPMQQMYPDYNAANQLNQAPQTEQNYDYQAQYGQVPHDYAAYQQGYLPNQDMQQGYYPQYPYQDFSQQAYFGQDYPQNAYQQVYDQRAFDQQAYPQQAYPQGFEQQYQQGLDQQQAYPQTGFDQQAYEQQMAYQPQYDPAAYDQLRYYAQQDANQAPLQQGYTQNASQVDYAQQGLAQEQYQQISQQQQEYPEAAPPQQEFAVQDAFQQNAADGQAPQQFVDAAQIRAPQPSDYAQPDLQQSGFSEIGGNYQTIPDPNFPQQEFDAQGGAQQEFPPLDADATQALDALQQPSYPPEFAEMANMQQVAQDQINADYAAAMAAGMVQPGVGATGSFADYASNKKPKRRKKSKKSAAQSQAQAQALKASGAHGTGRKKKMSGFKKALLIIGGAIICIVAVAAIGIGMYLGSINSNLKDGLDENVMGVLSEPKSAEEPFYTLILGSDTREEGGAGRSDTIILARIAPETKQVSLVSIPRDTQVQIEGHGTQKINAAYAFGGTAGAITAVSELAGVPISHVVEVDFSGFKEIVDALGGVTVDVPDNTYYEGVSIPSGKQTLDGDQALVFVRCRKTYASGDYQRAENQRQLIGAILKKTLSSSVVEMTGIINSITKAVSTDLSVTDILALANELRGMNTKDMITCVMPSHPGSQGGVSYVFVEEPAWSEMMETINEGGNPNDTKKSKNSSSSRSASSSSSNSSGI